MQNKKILCPSFAPPEKWRDERQRKKLRGEAWKALRLKILKRDNFTCIYCGYHSEKYQIVDHIDGDPENNTGSNLQAVCQMCNLIKHAGQGCVLKGIVDLYEQSKYNQNEVVRMTREMRDRGATDREIIKSLGLTGKVPFRMDRDYLKRLVAFISSRPSKAGNDMYDRWLNYHRTKPKEPKTEKQKTNLNDFLNQKGATD